MFLKLIALLITGLLLAAYPFPARAQEAPGAVCETPAMFLAEVEKLNGPKPVAVLEGEKAQKVAQALEAPWPVSHLYIYVREDGGQKYVLAIAFVGGCFKQGGRFLYDDFQKLAPGVLPDEKA